MKKQYCNYMINYLIFFIALFILYFLSNNINNLVNDCSYPVFIEQMRCDKSLNFISLIIYPLLLINTLFFVKKIQLKESLIIYDKTNTLVTTLGYFLIITFYSYSIITLFSLLILMTVNEFILIKKFKKNFNIIPFFCWFNLFFMLYFLNYLPFFLKSLLNISYLNMIENSYLNTNIFTFIIKEIIINMCFILFFKLSKLIKNKLIKNIVLYFYILLPLLIGSNLIYYKYLSNIEGNFSYSSGIFLNKN